MNWHWGYVANYIEDSYGEEYLNWDEHYFICPNCGTRIYQSDWQNHNDWEVCSNCNFDIVGEVDE